MPSSTISYGGASQPQSMPAPLLEEAGTSSDLTNAEKIVVDDTVHIDKDHATDIIRIEMHNDLKAPIVFNNSAHSPKKRFHVRPNGSVHTAGNVYADKIHAKNASGTEVDLLQHVDQEILEMQSDLDETAQIVDEASNMDDASGTLVKRDAFNTTVINNLVVRADEVSRSTAMYPPPGLLFDKGICETSLSCLDDAQVIFQPYTSGGAEITGRSYVFGRSEDSDDEKDGIHMQDITDVNDTMRLRLNVGKTLPSVLLVGAKNSGVSMFEIRNHAGDTTFSISPDGDVAYKGHEDGNPQSQEHHQSVAVSDLSLYIGSMRLSFDRANGELVMHVIARVPAYLSGLGYTLPTGPPQKLYTDYNVHEYCKFARDLASDQSLKISDVFPAATTADWTSYLPEATRNINTNISTHLTPMVNPQAYRNIVHTELDTLESPFQVADDTWLQIIEHDNDSLPLVAYLPDDPDHGQVCRIKNLNTSGDEHILVQVNPTQIWNGITIDKRFESVQLNGSGATGNPDTQTNQCCTMVYHDATETPGSGFWVRVGDGY